MNTRPDVVEELRSLFKKGATPSRLIRHIAVRHSDEQNLHFLVQDYFMEAFGVPIVRGLKPLDDFCHSDLRYAFLNEQLLHDMIAARLVWDARAGTRGLENGQQPWLESIVATPDEGQIEHIAKAPVAPQLAQGWARLRHR